jgi:hypothetical protein
MMHGAITLSWEAGELLFRSAGSSVALEGQKLQRYFLDLAMERTHGATPERRAERLARMHFGLPLEAERTEVVSRQIV